MELKVNAVMIRSCNYGENDKILTLLSAEQGKITAGIKGVRKATAKLKFCAQPFAFCEYVLSGKGGRYTVISASESESFYDIRLDISKFYAAGAVCETADALSLEGYDASALFYQTVQALTDICNGDEKPALIGFLLNALFGAGYGIHAEECPCCGTPLTQKQKLRFLMPSGSFTCEECSEGVPASPVTYHTVRRSMGLPCDEKMLTPDGERRALKLLREYLKYKLDAKCASLGELLRI